MGLRSGRDGQRVFPSGRSQIISEAFSTENEMKGMEGKDIMVTRNL
jgi:hypothetical protein